MGEKDDRVYIEQIGDSYRVMDSDQKADFDAMKVAIFVMIIGIIVIIANMGFTPWSFLAIVAWSVACIVLNKLIAFVAGLFVIYLVGRFIWWLFFT